VSPEAVQAPPAHTRPLWFAGLIAAVSVPFAYLLVVVVIEIANSGSAFGEEIMRGMGFLMMFGVPFCLVVMLVLGYPLALLLRKFGRLSALNLCAGAVVIGATVALLGGRMSPSESVLSLMLAAFGAVAGLFAGIVFCLVAGIPFRRNTP